jgi:hypothetical protein
MNDTVGNQEKGNKTMRTSMVNIKNAVARLNSLAGSPHDPYTINSGTLVNNVGNYHVEQSASGYALEQVANEKGATRRIAYGKAKREILALIEAYTDGIEEGKKAS